VLHLVKWLEGGWFLLGVHSCLLVNVIWVRIFLKKVNGDGGGKIWWEAR